MTPHGAPSGAGRGMSPGSLTQDRACPQDGTQMQVHGNGEMICPRCGFKSFVGMAEGHSFMADPAQAIPKNPSGSVAPRRMAALDHRCTICQGVLVDKGSDASGTVASCADCGTRHSITTDAAVLDFDTFGAPKPTASTAIARRAREVLAQEGTHDQ